MKVIDWARWDLSCNPKASSWTIKRGWPPPWTSLRELKYASLQLERDDVIHDPKYADWLRLLTYPGSTLGEARPKACIIDENGHLWIAKFPVTEMLKIAVHGRWYCTSWPMPVALQFRRWGFKNSLEGITRICRNALTGVTKANAFILLRQWPFWVSRTGLIIMMGLVT